MTRSRTRVFLLCLVIAAAGAALYFGVKPPPAPKPLPAGGSLYPYGRVVVLTIGINRYPNLKNALNLQCAERDAEKIGELLSTKYGYEVVSLLGPDATKSRVLQVLRELGEGLGPNDALIVFFAGHGKMFELPQASEAGYLVPADAHLDLQGKPDSDSWAEQALDMHYLTDLLAGMNAKHVLFIADSCCSGFMSERGAGERWDLKNFLSWRSRMVVTATTATQSARENPNTGHGYFTEALLAELKKGELASVLDVFAPLQKEVQGKTSGNMSPQMARFGSGDGMFVFIPVSKRTAELERDLKEIEAGIEPTRDEGLSGAAKRVRSRVQAGTKLSEAVELLEVEDYRQSDEPEKHRQVWEAKFQRFRRNAAQGELWAVVATHFCYSLGIGTEKDPAQAYFWATQAKRYSKSTGVASYLLGRCYLLGWVEKTELSVAKEVARKLFKESADAGFGPGLLALAQETLKDPPSEAKALLSKGLLERAIDAGTPVAESDLAHLLLSGAPGVKKDVGEATRLFEGCAKRGHAQSDYKLFVLYSEGVPGYLERDLPKAESHLKRAASGGNPEALYALGREYAFDTRLLGIKEDLKTAFSLFERGSLCKHSPSLLASAVCFGNGKGTVTDYELAKKRLEAAVEDGYVEADLTQGKWYLQGTAYPKSPEKALQCYKRAAGKGNALANYQAGGMYSDRIGFEVRGAADGYNVVYHEDFHRGLHYLFQARELGVEEKLKRRAEEILLNFKFCLLGDIEQEIPFNPLRPLNQKQKEEFRRTDPAWNMIHAKKVAQAWKRDYPETFLKFAKKALFHPDTFQEVTEPSGKKQ